MTDEKTVELLLPYRDKGDRLVRVFVPPHDEGETLPVIYMTDGQNLFDDDNVRFGCWYTREAVKAERENTGKAAIIVGIHNDGSPWERANELMPKSIGEPMLPPEMPEEARKMVSPEGEEFDDFIINTVMPAVEARFPVKKGRESTAFCGSSSGGVQSFYTALTHPDLFGAAGVFSPCFMLFKPEDLAGWIFKSLREKMPYLYLYSGAGDDMEKMIYQCMEGVYDILSECYPPQSLNEVVLLENKHHEDAWAEIFKDFLHTFLSVEL